MEAGTETSQTLWEHLQSGAWIQSLSYLLIGFILTLIVRWLFGKLRRTGRIPRPILSIARKTLVALIWLFAIIHALGALGINVFSILGAAGVAGIAIGFASQTALSNLISGIFLLSERSLQRGDYVRVNGQEGSVEKIRLLSITLKQADGAEIRIPCETMIKNPVTNITGTALRRCDFDLGVDYGSDLEQVRQVILRVIDAQGLLASTPAPSITFSNFGDSALNLHIGAWCKTEDYHEARYLFATALLEAFRQEGIGIPFPTRSLFLQKEGTAEEPS